MKVLVTGGTGLVGCHTVAELLKQGFGVRMLVRDTGKARKVLAPFGIEPPDPFTGDIHDAGSLRQALQGCDAVVHAAGIFSDRLEDAGLLHHTNVDGTRSVLQAASELGIDPVIYISSIMAVFPADGDLMTANESVKQPHNMYTRTKAEAEAIVRDYQARGLPVTTIYPGSVHGPMDPTFSIGPQITRDILKEGKVLVTEGGLPVCDARDIARAVAACLQAGKGPRRYMFGGPFVTHTELHALLCELTGRPLKAMKVPGRMLRLMGRLSDLWQRVSHKPPRLTHEAAVILTQSVPCDNEPAARDLGIRTMSARDSYRDLLLWMRDAGHLTDADIGTLGRH